MGVPHSVNCTFNDVFLSFSFLTKPFNLPFLSDTRWIDCIILDGDVLEFWLLYYFCTIDA